MKKIVAIIFCSTLLIVSCNNKSKSKEVKEKPDDVVLKPTLEFVWETDSLLTTCESVLFDETSQTIYVANVNNSPWSRDENGFISTINTKGEITKLKWAEGLSSPKGMGVFNGALYVADIDRVVEIDLKTQKVRNEFLADGDPHLNDISTGGDGVYISGSNSDAIYKIEHDKLTVVANDTLGSLNGLLVQKEGIYYAAFASHNFGFFNIENKTFTTLTTDIGQGDGVIRLENGDFIVSSWAGEIFYIHHKDWSKTRLLDTRNEKINAADIGFIPETQTLLVPAFFHNRVMAYKLSYK